MGVSRAFESEAPPSEPSEIQSRIAQCDADASILRNRSQITPRIRARIDTLSQQSAALRAGLNEKSIQETDTEADQQAKQFALGHSLYRKHQAPVLTTAQSALHDLTLCCLPTALERDVVQLISNLDRHRIEMSAYTPSQGIPDGMHRILLAF